jgi:hypothetical protein
MAGKRIDPVAAIAAAATMTGGEASPTLETVLDFLQRLGYLAPGSFHGGTLDQDTAEALALYQRRNGLAVTGRFDEPTRQRMTTARCGMPDGADRAGFVTRCPWTRYDLTYAFDSGTADVAGAGEFAAVAAAFATWAAVTPFTFTEVALNQNPDIVIGWRVAADDPDFDLVGSIAHSDYPPGCSDISDALPKPVHFNDSEVPWSIGQAPFSYDVESAALHELGHILGLDHSNVPGAVMSRPLSIREIRRVLTPDDLSGIRELYPAVMPTEGGYTIRQKSSGRFLDAHEIEERDFRLVTRPAQHDDTQRWLLRPVAVVHTIRHENSGRFLDADQTGFGQFRVMTRPAENDDVQRWIVMPVSITTVTIRQLSSGRLLDAHEVEGLDFAAVTRPAQDDDSQRWMLSSAGPHTFTVQQRSSGRYLDAHETAAKNFAVVTRPAQTDETQQWIFAPAGTIYTVRQVSSGRFLDAHEIAAKDFAAVTRPAQGDDTQFWVLVPTHDGSFTIRQLSSGRFLDASRDGDSDFGVVTRRRENDDDQRWWVEQSEM